MARGKKLNSKDMVEDPRDELLSRFVIDQDQQARGESIGVEGKVLVLKNGKDFFMIPVEKVEIEDKILRVKGKVDWKKARVKGEKWKKRELDPL